MSEEQLSFHYPAKTFIVHIDEKAGKSSLIQKVAKFQDQDLVYEKYELHHSKVNTRGGRVSSFALANCQRLVEDAGFVTNFATGEVEVLN
mmetsp:Transcript_1778/g.3129  ORF Transcript_1778/g.3129 Transcript_1778/m.3129 type:complete len:90 (-) Transcript_1778:60-329(-)